MEISPNTKTEPQKNSGPTFHYTGWLPSIELTYPTLAKGKSSSKGIFLWDMLVPRMVIGLLIMVYWNHNISGQYNPPQKKALTIRDSCIAQLLFPTFSSNEVLKVCIGSFGGSCGKHIKVLLGGDDYNPEI